MPIPGLQMKTPLEILFHCFSNYKKLRTFGCLCFPWLAPYINNKLQPKSQPCIFLGYSSTQSAYYCFNPNTQKFYTSRHVQFVEDVFPISSAHNFDRVIDTDSYPNIVAPPIIPSYPPVQPPHLPEIPLSTSNFENSNLSLSTSIESLSPTPHFDFDPSATTTPSTDPTSSMPHDPTPDESPPSHSTPLLCLPSPPHDSTPPKVNSPHVPTLDPLTISTSDDGLYTQSSPPVDVAAPPPCSTETHLPSHPMVTRSKSGIFKPKKLHLATKFPLAEPIKPSCLTNALKHPE